MTGAVMGAGTGAGTGPVGEALAGQVAAAQQLLAADASQFAGPLGLVVVLLLGTATVLLVRNMDRRMKRLPAQFRPPEDTPPAEPPRDPAP